MKKITILALVLVLCLGAIGVGYAKWTDEINIEGTVTTGCVDLEVTKYSGTWVYKDLISDDLKRISGWVDQVTLPDPEDPNMLLVAFALSKPGDEPNEIVVEFDNLFPGQMYRADFQFHYVGSIPAYVNWVIEWESEWLQELVDSGYIRVVVWGDDPTTGKLRDYEITKWPVQMHYCDYAVVDIEIKIPQEPAFECLLDGSFTAKITAVQWK